MPTANRSVAALGRFGDGCAFDAAAPDLANLVRAEYNEMPGLALTEAQVERLWHLDVAQTRTLLAKLVAEGFLRCAPRGAYVRSDICAV